MTFLNKTVIKLLLIMPLAFSSLVYASTETGLSWLSAQVSSDNNYTVNTKIATPFQSLSELHTTLKANAQTVPPIVLSQINANDYNGTEYLSRKIRMNSILNGFKSDPNC